jgi:hypothetical protein
VGCTRFDLPGYPPGADITPFGRPSSSIPSPRLRAPSRFQSGSAGLRSRLRFLVLPRVHFLAPLNRHSSHLYTSSLNLFARGLVTQVISPITTVISNWEGLKGFLHVTAMSLTGQRDASFFWRSGNDCPILSRSVAARGNATGTSTTLGRLSSHTTSLTGTASEYHPCTP